MRTAFIGLGVMGYPMAGHLAKAGHHVTVYNRTGAKADAWVKQHGGASAATPAEAARDAEVVFSCVGNDDDLRAVVLGEEGAFTHMAPGAVFVDHTTTSAIVARELAGMGGTKGLAYLDAPVSGGQAGAENGQLTVMVGGDDQAFATAEPLMRAYGKAVTLMGPVGNGQLTKMVNQICIAGLVQGLAEALEFAARAGLDAHQVVGCDLEGRGAVVADGKPRRHHDRRQVRLRLRRGLDAQGSGHLSRRGPGQRRAVAGDRAGGPVLCRAAGQGRRPLGYLQPDPAVAVKTWASLRPR